MYLRDGIVTLDFENALFLMTYARRNMILVIRNIVLLVKRDDEDAQR
jgi:hypothetical protein